MKGVVTEISYDGTHLVCGIEMQLLLLLLLLLMMMMSCHRRRSELAAGCETFATESTPVSGRRRNLTTVSYTSQSTARTCEIK